MKEYYIIENGKREGPFSFEDLKGKTIFPDTQIWEANFKNWKNASDVTEMARLIKKTPPPLPIVININEIEEVPKDELNTSSNTYSEKIEQKNITSEFTVVTPIDTDIKIDSNSRKKIIFSVIGVGALIFLFFTFSSSGVSTTECKSLAMNSASAILNSNAVGGGSQMTVYYDNCERKNGLVEMDVEITFHGNYNSNNYYEVYGHLIVNDNCKGRFIFTKLNSKTPEYIHLSRGESIYLH